MMTSAASWPLLLRPMPTAEVEAYRERYGAMGCALYRTAVRLLAQLNQQSDTLELAPGDLTTIARALVIAADLEALALRLKAITRNQGADRHGMLNDHRLVALPEQTVLP
jgi:hypothetical protein